MKLAFIVPGFSADARDWCIPAHTDLITELARAHEVHVFAMRYPHRVDTYALGGATIHSFNGVGSRGATTARLWQQVIRALHREHHRGRFGVIHSIFGSEAGTVAVLASKLLGGAGIPWLVNGELIGLPDIGYGADVIARQRLMNRYLLRTAARVLCGCDLLAQAGRRRVPAARRSAILTLPLGVNTDRFTLKNRFGSPVPHFVNAGSLLPVKDQSTLLRAFALLRAQLPAAHLTIAGAGPLANTLETLAAELGIANSVRFTGNLAHDQLPTLYGSSDVFVQASRHEGQGMALLEAAACGAALCGTNVGALHDLALRGAARACGSRDAHALAQVMSDAYSNRAVLAARAGEIVHCEYNLGMISGRLGALDRTLA